MSQWRFPNHFLWGASTAAHQVEGGLRNSWTTWEAAQAKRLAAASEEKFAHWLPNWSDIANQANDPANYISGRAADHWHRFDEDMKLLQQLNLTAYRFSVEWSRIEPRPGRFDQKVLDEYARRCSKLRTHGIEPFVTLWHWTLPIWAAQKGGFENQEVVDAFTRFCQHVAVALSPSVRFWLTINEPQVYASISYLTGEWPPQVKNPLRYLQVLRHLQAAHRSAYAAIHQIQPNATVGLAKHQIDFEVGDSSPFTLAHRWVQNWWWNRWFLDGIQGQLDYIGVNHYGRNRFTNGRSNQNENIKQSDLGWELYPPSLYGALKETWDRFHLPIYITEHGLADRNDTNREWFITESLKYVHQAIEEGMDIRGYLHWSLLDNFEWDKGFWPEFGLVHVDRATLKRTIRPSARAYAEIARSGTLRT